MKIENLSLKGILESRSLFLYGNDRQFIDSFLGLIKKFLSSSAEFIEVSASNRKPVLSQADMFTKKETVLVFSKADDRHLDLITESLNKHKCIIVQGNFLKAKSLASTLQKNRQINSVPFFTNSQSSYIEFLLKNLGYDTDKLSVVLKEVSATGEDPLTTIEKLAITNFCDIQEHNTKRQFAEFEPITVLRILSSYIKNSYGKINFLPKDKSFSDLDVLEKILNLEIQYKTKNLKSKIFIQKEFL